MLLRWGAFFRLRTGYISRDLLAVDRHQIAGRPRDFLDRHAHEMCVVDLSWPWNDRTRPIA